MTTFLFWNLNRKPLHDLIANLAATYSVDVLMLAECAISPARVLSTLNSRERVEYDYAISPGCTKIRIFTRFSKRFIPAVQETDRLTIRHLRLPGLKDILLSVTHFPSQLHWKPSSQAAECSHVSDLIRQVEAEVGHRRTVLVGDLNMCPFEAGVVNANGLHGVMSRNIAEARARTVQGRQYPFFYNPMWGFLGDVSPDHPPGTYYRRSAEHTEYFWYMLDQILLRPDLLDCFRNDDLRILVSNGGVSFLTEQGLPNKSIASDHLPILFRLAL
jgi:exonuclease III